jgi:hypothetical protein
MDFISRNQLEQETDAEEMLDQIAVCFDILDFF